MMTPMRPLSPALVESACGVTTTVWSRPPRSTTNVTACPARCSMTLWRSSAECTAAPLARTTTSPVCRPAARAGSTPWASGENPLMATALFWGAPMNTNSPHSKTKAITPCMADPATATMSRLWKGRWR
jgi:hypothetical protein